MINSLNFSSRGVVPLLVKKRVDLTPFELILANGLSSKSESSEVEDASLKRDSDDIRKLSEEVIRLKVIEESEGETKKRFDEEIRKLSEGILRLKTQDEIRTKFEEAEIHEMGKTINDTLIRLNPLEESRVEARALIQKMTEKLHEEELKLKYLDERLGDELGRIKIIEEFKVKGVSEIKEIKERLIEMLMKIKYLEESRVKDAESNAELQLRRKTEEDERALVRDDQNNRITALKEKITKEESRITKLCDLFSRNDAELQELRAKLKEKEIRIKALEDIRVKDEARRKAEADTRLKRQNEQSKKQSEENQRNFAILGILVTVISSGGVFYIDNQNKKERTTIHSV